MFGSISLTSVFGGFSVSVVFGDRVNIALLHPFVVCLPRGLAVGLIPEGRIFLSELWSKIKHIGVGQDL